MARLLLLPPLAILAVPAFALSIKDDDLVVGLKAQLQLRANLLNDATTAAGAPYDPLRGTTGEAENARYVVRRAMVGLNARYGTAVRGVVQLRGAENTARTGTGATDPVNVWFAYAEGTVDTGPLNHALKLGLDKAFSTEASISSTEYLFPTDRPVAGIATYRGVGAAYKVTGPWFACGVDHLNNSTATKDTQAGNGTGIEPRNGSYQSLRIELSPGADWWIKRRTESFLGRAGTEALLGFDAGYDRDSLSDNGTATTITSKDTLVWGPDLLVHWEQLSLLAELRRTRTDAATLTDATGARSDATTPGQTWNVQAGWAIPLSIILLEPCIRISRLDGNRLQDESAVYGNGENGGSGRQWDGGLNGYWFYKGHDLKTQFALSRWKAEAGDGRATILRIQQQVAF